MYRLVGQDIQKARYFFETYSHNQAVIFSIFENQYEGYIYLDNPNEPNWAILQTPFLQHFIAGKPKNGCEKILEEILFSIILNEQDEKEIVLLTDDIEWNSILQEIYVKRHGVSDFRKIYAFSLENYKSINRPSTPNDIEIVIDKSKPLPFSLKDTWSAKIILDKKVISHCNALMVGKKMVEIDIGTEENYRERGYATISALALIDRLLEVDLTPTWSTWPFRLESQHIAEKLGFIKQPDAIAWIWMEAGNE